MCMYMLLFWLHVVNSLTLLKFLFDSCSNFNMSNMSGIVTSRKSDQKIKNQDQKSKINIKINTFFFEQ